MMVYCLVLLLWHAVFYLVLNNMWTEESHIKQMMPHVLVLVENLKQYGVSFVPVYLKYNVQFINILK